MAPWSLFGYLVPLGVTRTRPSQVLQVLRDRYGTSVAVRRTADVESGVVRLVEDLLVVLEALHARGWFVKHVCDENFEMVSGRGTHAVLLASMMLSVKWSTERVASAAACWPWPSGVPLPPEARSWPSAADVGRAGGGALAARALASPSAGGTTMTLPQAQAVDMWLLGVMLRELLTADGARFQPFVPLQLQRVILDMTAIDAQARVSARDALARLRSDRPAASGAPPLRTSLRR